MIEFTVINHRDVFGKLYYQVKRQRDGAVFSVTKGNNKIVRHMPWYLTDARLDVGLVIGEEIPRFESFIKAVSYLKHNIDNLL